MLELNASDARGIEVVRSKIKMFAQKKVTLPPGRHKLIILDEVRRECGVLSVERGAWSVERGVWGVR